MKIKIIKVDLNTEIEKRAGGTYPGHKVVYEDGGEVRSKGFHQKALEYREDLKEVIEGMEPDEWYDVKMEKNDSGFWDWVSVTKTSAEAPQSSTSSKSSPKSYGGGDTTGVAVGHALSNAVHLSAAMVSSGDDASVVASRGRIKQYAYMIYDLSIEMQDEIRNGTREDKSEF